MTTLTAHKPTSEFHATFDITQGDDVPIFPNLQMETGAIIQTEDGDNIQIEGPTVLPVLLSAYKIRRSTFIAVGGND